MGRQREMRMTSGRINKLLNWGEELLRYYDILNQAELLLYVNI